MTSIKVQTLKALVNDRLTAAAEEIFVLFERVIAEYEEELSYSKEENQKTLLDNDLGPRIALVSGNVRAPSTSPRSNLNQDVRETAQIKEEPWEHSVKQEDERLPVSVPEFSDVFAERAECSLFLQRHTEHSEEAPEDISTERHLTFTPETEEDTVHSHDIDNDAWELPVSFPGAPMETEADGDHYNRVYIKDRRTATQKSVVSFNYKSGQETVAYVSNRGTSGTDKETERKTHQCNICKKKFRVKHALQIHFRVHTGERPYSCPICSKAFTQKGNLDAHKNTHAKTKPYSCLICKKTFSQKGSLEIHKRGHTGEKPFSCILCKKKFVKKSDLDCHRKTHTGEKPYSCEICNKSFARKFTLKTHRLIHTGTKPYSCSICMQTFARKSSLKVHRRTHTGDKPFRCLHCNKTFGYKCNLDEHVRIHTGEKPYSCPFCGKSFSRKSTLEKHRRIHINQNNHTYDLSEVSKDTKQLSEMSKPDLNRR